MSAQLRSFSAEPAPEPPPPRKRHPWWKIGGWIVGALVLLVLVVVTGIAVLLNSKSFHHYLIAKAESVAGEQLGVRVGLQNFALHLSNLSLDLYGLTVAGANPHPNPPILQVQHAEAGVSIVSVLHKKWYISSFRIDHPVVHVIVDKDGTSNIPTINSSGKNKSNITIFDLGIRHAVLDQGEIYYNDRKSPLEADLHNLDLHAVFDNLQQKYSSTLAYDNGRIVFGEYKPFEHDFNAEFALTPTMFQLQHATLASGLSQVNLFATATNFSAPGAPIVQAQYDVTIDGAQMAKLMNNTSIPQGMIKLNGSAHYQPVANEATLNALEVNGQLASPRLVVKSGTVGAVIENLGAHYALVHGNADLQGFHASLLGGELTAQGTMKDLGGNTHSELTAALHNISLASATRLAGPAASKSGVALSGVLNATARASWGKTLHDLVAHTDATIHGSVGNAQGGRALRNVSAPGPAATPAEVPIDSEIHATYSGVNGEIALNRSYARTTGATLTMNGVVSRHSSLAIDLQANNLSELAAIANSFRTPAPTQAPLQLAGKATFQGTVQGSTSAPHLDGQLNASNLEVNGTSWKVLRAHVDASPSQASLQGGDLEAQTKGRVTFSGSAALNKWAFTKTSSLQVALDAAQMNIADLVKLTGQQIPLTGTCETHVTLRGSEMNPVGNGRVSLTRVTAYEQPIRSLQIKFDGTGDQANANLAVELPAGTVQGSVQVRPREKTYTAQLSSRGIEIGQLEAIKAKNLDMAGTLAINASGQGSFDNPQLNASVQIPSLTVQKQNVQGVDLNLAVANHVANVNLNSSAVNTTLRAKARVDLTGEYQTDVSIDTQGIPIQPLIAVYSPAQAAAVQGETELHATVHGPLNNRNVLQAHLTVPYLRLGFNNKIQLAATAPIHVDYVNGVVTLQRGAIQGTDTNLQFQGSIPVASPIASARPMSLLLQGNVDLQLAQLFDPDVRSSGQVKFDIDSKGAGANLGGEIDIVNANFASASLPLGLQHGNGVLKLTTDRIEISSFEGTVGGGKVTASGGVAYRPNIQFNLGVTASGIRMLYPQGMREAIDANIHLVGTTENATLGGTVNLADLSFTPAFDLSSFVDQFSSGVATPSSQGLVQNINLNLAVHSTNNVNLVSRTLSLNGSANLQVRGTAADPVVLGRVNLTGGDILLNNDRFVLTGGTIQFVNPYQTQPVVNIAVTTTIQQYNIDLRLSGPTDHLETKYTSDPALPQADIINLLAFGQTTEASAVASAGTTTTQTGESLVASQVSSQVTSRISKVAGISQLSISPVLGNAANQGNGANITVQQRVTGNLFITFSENTATTQDVVVQGQYKISPRVSVSATRDPNGGFAFDTLIKKTW